MCGLDNRMKEFILNISIEIIFFILQRMFCPEFNCKESEQKQYHIICFICFTLTLRFCFLIFSKLHSWQHPLTIFGVLTWVEFHRKLELNSFLVFIICFCLIGLLQLFSQWHVLIDLRQQLFGMRFLIILNEQNETVPLLSLSLFDTFAINLIHFHIDFFPHLIVPVYLSLKRFSMICKFSLFFDLSFFWWFFIVFK